MGGKRADLFRFAHEHQKDVVWMSQNTNTIPLDPSIGQAVIDSVEAGEYHLYGYRPGVFGLQDAILEDLGLEEGEVFITNGGIEALYAAQRALLQEGDEVIATDPSFLPIHQQAWMSRARVVEVPIYGEPWRLTPEGIEKHLTKQTKTLLVIDPHNPLGISYTRDEIRSFAGLAKDQGLYLFHDVTYRDFNDGHVLGTDFYPEGTLLFYSFSKGPGLAGMRVGALVGPANLVEKVKAYDTNVLGVNVLAQRAALASLRSKAKWIRSLREVCRRNQGIIRKTVEDVEGAFLPVYPSKSNTFIVDLQDTGVDPADLEEEMLLKHKVHIRAGYYLSELFGQKFVRISFSVPTEQCERFTPAFSVAMDKLRS